MKMFEAYVRRVDRDGYAAYLRYLVFSGDAGTVETGMKRGLVPDHGFSYHFDGISRINGSSMEITVLGQNINESDFFRLSGYYCYNMTFETAESYRQALLARGLLVEAPPEPKPKRILELNQ